MKDIVVIDADAHLREEDRDLLPYMGEVYQNRHKPFYPSDNWERSMGGKLGIYVRDIATRLKHMDQEAIDLQVLFPTEGLGIGLVRDPNLAVALCRAYNDHLARVCKETPRLKGVALVPIQSIAEAVEELDRAVSKLGLIGVMLPAHGHGKNLGSREFYPLYEAAQRLDCAVCIHANPHGAVGVDRFESFIGIHTVGHPVEQMIQLTGIIFGGIPELYSRLRIAFFEAGVGWAPYWMERMDEEYERRAPEAPLLKAKPSDYMRSGRIFYSCDPDEQILPYVVERMGEDVILYASDYPHWDSRFPDSAKMIQERGDLSATAKRKILGENAKRFYRLS
jgi:predicted TIM-barrel fold metal-dependent hydrolase